MTKHRLMAAALGLSLVVLSAQVRAAEAPRADKIAAIWTSEGPRFRELPGQYLGDIQEIAVKLLDGSPEEVFARLFGPHAKYNDDYDVVFLKHGKLLLEAMGCAKAWRLRIPAPPVDLGLVVPEEDFLDQLKVAEKSGDYKSLGDWLAMAVQKAWVSWPWTAGFSLARRHQVFANLGADQFQPNSHVSTWHSDSSDGKLSGGGLWISYSPSGRTLYYAAAPLLVLAEDWDIPGTGSAKGARIWPEDYRNQIALEISGDDLYLFQMVLVQLIQVTSDRFNDQHARPRALENLHLYVKGPDVLHRGMADRDFPGNVSCQRLHLSLPARTAEMFFGSVAADEKDNS